MDCKRPLIEATKTAISDLCACDSRVRGDTSLVELCGELVKRRFALQCFVGELVQWRQLYEDYLLLVHRAERELVDLDLVLPFTWTDTHTQHEEQTVSSWDFELASIMYNLAVVTMQMGDALPLSSCHRARQLWAEAAGMFRYIEGQYARPLVEQDLTARDLSHETLLSLQSLCLSRIQASLCIQSWARDLRQRSASWTDILYTCRWRRKNLTTRLSDPPTSINADTYQLALGASHLYRGCGCAFSPSMAAKWMAHQQAQDRMFQAIAGYSIACAPRGDLYMRLASLRRAEASCLEIQAMNLKRVQQTASEGWEMTYVLPLAQELLPELHTEMRRLAPLHRLYFPRTDLERYAYGLIAISLVVFLGWYCLSDVLLASLKDILEVSVPPVIVLLWRIYIVLYMYIFSSTVGDWIMRSRTLPSDYGPLMMGDGLTRAEPIPYTPPKLPPRVRRLGASASAARRAECTVCMELIPVKDGLYCKTKARVRHFHCNDCVEQYAISELAGDRVAVGDLRCSLDREGMKDRCNAPAWNFKDLQAHLSKRTLAALLQAASEAAQTLRETVERQRIQLTQKRNNEEHLLRMELQAAAQLQRGERMRKMRHSIIEAVTYLRCPRCTAVFRDYDGCIALKCGVPACGAAFCAMCLEDCGTDAHAHTLSKHGSHFIAEERVQAEHKQRRQALLQSAIDSLAEEDAIFKKDLLAVLQQDVREIGLDTKAVRIAAGQRPAAVPVRVPGQEPGAGTGLLGALGRMAAVIPREQPRQMAQNLRRRLAELDEEEQQQLYRAQLAATLGRNLNARELALMRSPCKRRYSACRGTCSEGTQRGISFLQRSG